MIDIVNWMSKKKTKIKERKVWRKKSVRLLHGIILNSFIDCKFHEHIMI
jgi:hypothetical protein